MLLASSIFLYSSTDADTKRRRLRYSDDDKHLGSSSEVKTIRFDISNFLSNPPRPGEVFITAAPSHNFHGGDNDSCCCLYHLEGLIDLDGCIIFYLVFNKGMLFTKHDTRNKITAKWTYQIGRSSTTSKEFEYTFHNTGGVNGERAGFFRWLKYHDVAASRQHHLDIHGNLVVGANLEVFKALDEDEMETASISTPFDRRHQHIQGVDELSSPSLFYGRNSYYSRDFVGRP